MGMHGPGGGMHGPQGYGGAGMVDTHLNAIKSELKLTADQTKAWEAFEKSVRNQVQTMHEGRTSMHTGEQNPDAHIAFMEQRLAGMTAVQKARTELYQVLTPEQKAVIDRYGFHGPRY
jgi:Spy/CpxP family protein refolding chaperone